VNSELPQVKYTPADTPVRCVRGVEKLRFSTGWYPCFRNKASSWPCLRSPLLDGEIFQLELLRTFIWLFSYPLAILHTIHVAIDYSQFSNTIETPSRSGRIRYGLFRTITGLLVENQHPICFPNCGRTCVSVARKAQPLIVLINVQNSAVQPKCLTSLSFL